MRALQPAALGANIGRASYGSAKKASSHAVGRSAAAQQLVQSLSLPSRIAPSFGGCVSSLRRQRAAGRRVSAGARQTVMANAAPPAAEVETVLGVRVVPMESEQGRVMRVEYKIKWKDGAADTWEPARNVAEDILRDYESRWWNCARRGDNDTMKEMIDGGREVLAVTRDQEGRTALHYSCGVGNDECVKTLLTAQTEVDAGDKDGYTPLHIAAGYLHKGIVRKLLDAGADPELEDKKGRSPLALVQSIKDSTPTTPEFFTRRNALDEVAKELESHLFEELEPLAVLAKRGEGTASEFLVRWPDGTPDTWEPERNLADDVIADFQLGLEYCSAGAVLERRRGRAGSEFLVEWKDGNAPSWEPEDHVAVELIMSYMDQQQQEKRQGAAAAPAGGEGGKQGGKRQLPKRLKAKVGAKKAAAAAAVGAAA